MRIDFSEPELDELQLTAGDLRLDLAVGLYAGRRLTLGRAARIAGVPYAEFLRELGRRGLCVDYTIEDAVADVETVQRMHP